MNLTLYDIQTCCVCFSHFKFFLLQNKQFEVVFYVFLALKKH